jgi:hypothetical protein
MANFVDRHLGMGLRMVIHLGLHIDVEQATHLPNRSLEDVEIRRRVFWGSFVCEKLQSLYLGRPIFIHERDVHVPKKFLDVYEEEEIWSLVPEPETDVGALPTCGITSFKSLCVLSEICGDIISSFYAVKAMKERGRKLLNIREEINQRLINWNKALPEQVRFTPWIAGAKQVAPIHVIILQSVLDLLYNLRLLLTYLVLYFTP